MKPIDERRERARVFGALRRERRRAVAVAQQPSLAASEQALSELLEANAQPHGHPTIRMRVVVEPSLRAYTGSAALGGRQRVELIGASQTSALWLERSGEQAFLLAEALPGNTLLALESMDDSLPPTDSVTSSEADSYGVARLTLGAVVIGSATHRRIHVVTSGADETFELLVDWRADASEHGD